MNSHEVFIHIHQGCFAGTGAIVRLPQCQWSKPDGYGKISRYITTTKHSKAKTVCIFLGIYWTPPLIAQSVTTATVAVKWACEKWYLTRSTSKFIAVLFKHDDVSKWEHFPRHWPFVRGIHRSPVNSPHKGQWREALMFSLISINVWVNNEAGDWRRHHAH